MDILTTQTGNHICRFCGKNVRSRDAHRCKEAMKFPEIQRKFTKKDKTIADIGKRVKEQRLKQGIGQRELGRMAGLSSAYMSQLESGNRGDMDFGVTKIIRLALALKVSSDYLLGLRLGQPSPYSMP